MFCEEQPQFVGKVRAYSQELFTIRRHSGFDGLQILSNDMVEPLAAWVAF